MKSRCAFIIESLQDEMDNEKFSDWEREFMDNMVEQLETFGEDRIELILSDRQKECLEKIWAKF